jgi:hypothetical protein
MVCAVYNYGTVNQTLSVTYTPVLSAACAIDPISQFSFCAKDATSYNNPCLKDLYSIKIYCGGKNLNLASTSPTGNLPSVSLVSVAPVGWPPTSTYPLTGIPTSGSTSTSASKTTCAWAVGTITWQTGAPVTGCGGYCSTTPSASSKVKVPLGGC